MTRYIAFLRAINITGRFVKMDEVRRLIASIGCTNVQTYIQSGNVLFEASDTRSEELEYKIEERLQHALGYPVATFLRSATELIELVYSSPFQDNAVDDGSVLYIVFLRNEPRDGLQRTLVSYSNEIDTLHVYKRQVVWLWRKHRGATTFSNAKIEKILGTQATLRNATTVRKIVAKYLLNG